MAFDVLALVSGSFALRVSAQLFATFGLMLDNWVRVFYMASRDGRLLDVRGWLRAWRWFWGRGGLMRSLAPAYRRWYRRDFHPWQQDDGPLIEAGLARLAADGLSLR